YRFPKRRTDRLSPNEIFRVYGFFLLKPSIHRGDSACRPLEVLPFFDGRAKESQICLRVNVDEQDPLAFRRATSDKLWFLAFTNFPVNEAQDHVTFLRVIFADCDAGVSRRFELHEGLLPSAEVFHASSSKTRGF